MEPDIKGYKNDIKLILEDKINSYHYSNVSLIEIKWKFMKLEKINDKMDLQEKFDKFQNVLLKDKRFSIIYQTQTNINQISDKLRNLNQSDYFDTIIGASSIWFTDLFITEDIKLKTKLLDLNSNEEYNKEYLILNWRDYKMRIQNPLIDN